MARLGGEVGQLPLFRLASSWRPPRLSELPTSWAGARRVSIDCETRDPDLQELGCGARRSDSYLAGVSFAIEDGPSYYLPLRHSEDNVESPEKALAYLRDTARTFRGELVGCNLQYDLDWLLQSSVEYRPNRFRDVQVAEALIDELQMSYSLDSIAKRHELPGKDEELLKTAAAHYRVSPKLGMAALPARYVGPYATQDVLLPLQILRRQDRLIEEQGLEEVWDLESRLLPVLLKMRRRGVRVHEGRLEQVIEWSRAQEWKCLAEVKRLTGVSIALGDTMKTGVVAPALISVGIEVPKRAAKGGGESYSIDKNFLASRKHQVADLILRARKVAKLRDTFAVQTLKHLVNGRIHATFNQSRRTDEEGDDEENKGAAYGRLSCEDPNLQQQPARDDFAKMWRSIYLPEEGAEWCSADFSQQEPRILVHYAELCKLPGASSAADRYRQDPLADNHTMMTGLIHGEAYIAELEKTDPDGLFKKLRGQCKNVFLGRCYGMGGAKLCHDLHLPTRWAVFYPKQMRRRARYFETRAEALACRRETGGRSVWEVAGEEGQRILDTFDSRLPFVKGLADRCERKASDVGYIKTLSDRRCRFPEEKDGSYGWTYKALNRLIQGSSADQTKRAVVDADDAGYFLQLQVHDELDLSITSKDEARGVADVMVNAYRLNIPFRVDLEIGPSWGEAVSWKEAA